MTGDEVSQCMLDIKAWFARTDCRKNMREGAESADFQRLEKAIDAQVSRSHKAILSEVNGGFYFMDKEVLGTSQIGDLCAELESSKKWKVGLVPLCGDAEAMLVVDPAHNDEILEWDAEDGLGDAVSRSLVCFMEDYRNSLLSGQFEYLEGIGVVEKMGGKPSRK